jgi:leader peptidase (prepilin peptidase)/N-methyltransferase
MYILIFIISFIIGIILNYVIGRISLQSLTKQKMKMVKLIVPFICCVCFELLFLRFGYTIKLAKSIIMTVILIIISIIDIKHRIIPDFMIVVTLAIGIVFSLISKNSFTDMILGMICGGGILFLLALIPNSMGGGDVKLMFAIGSFLGLNRTLWALMLAFIMSSIISIGLILFRIKGTKDYIPFSPFLSLGSFISVLLFL